MPCYGWHNADSEEIRSCGEEFLRIRGFTPEQIHALRTRAGSAHEWTQALQRYLDRCATEDWHLTRNDYFLAWQHNDPFWRFMRESDAFCEELEKSFFQKMRTIAREYS